MNKNNYVDLSIKLIKTLNLNDKKLFVKLLFGKFYCLSSKALNEVERENLSTETTPYCYLNFMKECIGLVYDHFDLIQFMGELISSVDTLDFKNCKDLDQIMDCVINLTEEEIKSLLTSDEWSMDNVTINKSLLKLINQLFDLNDNVKSFAEFCSGYGNNLCYFIKNNHLNLTSTAYDSELEATIYSTTRLKTLNYNCNIQQEDVLELDPSVKYDRIFCDFPWSGTYNATTKELKSNEWSPISVDGLNRNNFSWVYMANVINHLEKGGIGICLCPLNCLYSEYEKDIREKIINGGFIQTIIRLPSNIKLETSIPCAIIVFQNDKTSQDIKMLDLRDEGTRAGQMINFSDEELDNILEILSETIPSDNFVKANLDEINNHDNNLLPEKYLSKYQIETFPYDGVPLENYFKLSIRKTIIDRYNLSQEETKCKVKVLKASDIIDGTYDDERLDYLINPPENLEDFLLKDGDIVLTNKSTTIKSTVIHLQEGEKLVMFLSLYAIRIKSDLINPIFIQSFFNSHLGENVLSKASTGTAMKFISVDTLRKVLIPKVSKELENEYVKEYLQSLDNLNKLKEEEENIKNKINNLFDDVNKKQN